jgi:ankyrin repeat protein
MMVCNDGSTPLHWAAEEGHWNVVKYLEQRTKNKELKEKEMFISFNIEKVNLILLV